MNESKPTPTAPEPNNAVCSQFRHYCCCLFFLPRPQSFFRTPTPPAAGLLEDARSDVSEREEQGAKNN